MTEPVTLEQAKLHLRVDADDEDTLIGALIVAAREWVENYTGLLLVQRPVTVNFGAFCGRMELNVWPIATAPGLAVTYTDAAGATQTVAGARVRGAARPAAIVPAFGAVWPSASSDPVTVTITAGYADPADVPASLVAAMLLIVGNLYASRESDVVGMTYASTGAVESLCRPYRMPGIA